MVQHSHNANVALLMCTCAKYTAVANASIRLIAHYWPNHPELFLLGGVGSANLTTIPYACSEKDWIGMALEAGLWLQSKGFTHCYLILDDHPPIGGCNEHYLNVTLPSMANLCRASHVSLTGWDQLQPKNGKVISIGKEKWMNNSQAFKWKFDLHPGYWNLNDFVNILEMVVNVSPRVYSAREFEGVAGGGAIDLPVIVSESTYKIEGDSNAIGTKWYQAKARRRNRLYVLHVFRILSRLAGKGVLEKVDRKTEKYTQYINGPYPMFWSGVIKNGAMNTNLVSFAGLTKNKKLQKWLTSFEWS